MDMRAQENPHPHFMQPVLPGFTKHFSIPVAFCKYLNGKKCRQAMLRSPRGGDLWPVKISGRQFLQGWEAFAMHLDLHVGDFLVFRLEGGLVLDVKVFDPSACEKEYDTDTAMNKNTKCRQDCRKSMEVDTTNHGSKVRKKSSEPSATRAKPITFVGTVRPSYGNVLVLPRRFTAPNGLGSECLEVIVIDQSGKPWTIRLGHRKKDQRAFAHWRAFKVANGLTEGDMFTLKVIEKGKKPVLQFHRLSLSMEKKFIKRKSKMTICKQVAVSIAGKSPAPHFLGIVRLSTLYQLVPGEFMMKDESALETEQGEKIIKYSTEDSWVIILRNHKHQRFYISSGMRTLVIQSILKVGDEYKMELLRATEERLPLRSYTMS